MFNYNIGYVIKKINKNLIIIYPVKVKNLKYKIKFVKIKKYFTFNNRNEIKVGDWIIFKLNYLKIIKILKLN
uniref:30S ribosomal protein S17 n=1 Tax=Nephromyces sp. ex Molgula occidentalis TaxID=2544991 RepID=A0A5C1H868_9APIC|nr:30S ribosomal protein S17 [Nephromyces sp. ex Molgula occidentalis]